MDSLLFLKKTIAKSKPVCNTNPMINTEPTQLTLPLFHMNGNSAQTLTRQYYDAYNKLQEFIDTFSGIDFHARDYYPLGDEAWDKARKERDEARKQINEVYKYLGIHLEHCYNNGK